MSRDPRGKGKARTTCRISQSVSCDLKTLPYDKSLDSTHVERFEGVGNAEAVLAGVESDLIEVLLDQAFLLYELDVCQGVRSKLNRLSSSQSRSSGASDAYLVKPVLSTVGNIHDLHHLRQ